MHHKTQNVQVKKFEDEEQRFLGMFDSSDELKLFE